MKRAPNALPDPGAKNGTFASHRWLAGNTAVPFYYGFDEQLEKTIEFLRSGNYLNVDIFGLQNWRRRQAGCSARNRTASPSIRAICCRPFVVIQNKSIGHSLIPEVRDLYEAWVQFTVTDAAGAKIYESGFLKPDGMLEPGAHSFTNRPVNVVGDFVDNHVVSAIHSVRTTTQFKQDGRCWCGINFRLP